MKRQGHTGAVLVEVDLEDQVLVLCLRVDHFLETATGVCRDLSSEPSMPHSLRRKSRRKTYTLNDPSLSSGTRNVHFAERMTELGHGGRRNVDGQGDGHAEHC